MQRCLLTNACKHFSNMNVCKDLYSVALSLLDTTGDVQLILSIMRFHTKLLNVTRGKCSTF